MNGAKRRTAIVFSIVLICLILSASCLVVHGHECLGENCNVCCMIDAAQRLLGGMTVLALSILIAVLLKFCLHYFLIFIQKYPFSSLISLKVKLTD